MFQIYGNNTTRIILELAFYQQNLSHLLKNSTKEADINEYLQAAEQMSDVRYFALYPPAIHFLENLGIDISALDLEVVTDLEVFYEHDCFLSIDAKALGLQRNNIHVLISEKKLRLTLLFTLLKKVNEKIETVDKEFDVLTSIYTQNIQNIEKIKNTNTLQHFIDFKYNYEQTGLTAKVTLTGVKPQQSSQFFLNDGSIIALLPIGNYQYQVVWAVNNLILDKIKSNNANATNIVDFFNTLWEKPCLQKNNIHCIEKPTQNIEIGQWNLTAMRYESQDSILLGEAHQTVHPLAGQGFNLALNDVHNFMEVLVKYKKDCGLNKRKHKIIQQYNAKSSLTTVYLAKNIHRIWTLTKKRWFMNLLIQRYQSSKMKIKHINQINRVNQANVVQQIELQILKQVFG